MRRCSRQRAAAACAVCPVCGAGGRGRLGLRAGGVTKSWGGPEGGSGPVHSQSGCTRSGCAGSTLLNTRTLGACGLGLRCLVRSAFLWAVCSWDNAGRAVRSVCRSVEGSRGRHAGRIENSCA